MSSVGSAKSQGLSRSLRQMWAVAVYEFRWDLRKRRTLIVTAIVLITTFTVGYVLPTAQPNIVTGYASIRGLWWKATVVYVTNNLISGLYPLLVGGFSATDSIAAEYDKGTIVPLLVQPVRRLEVYLGKIIEKLLLMLALAGVTLVLAVGSSEASLGGQADLVWSGLFFLVVAATFFAFSALAFFLGSFMRSGTQVLGVLIGLLFGLQIGALILILSYGFAWWVYAVPVANWVLLVPAAYYYSNAPGGQATVNFGTGPAAGVFGIPSLDFLRYTALGTIIWSAVFLAVGYLFFRRRQVEG